MNTKHMGILMLCIYGGVCVAGDLEETLKERQKQQEKKSIEYCKNLIQELSPQDCKDLRGKIDVVERIWFPYEIGPAFPNKQEQQEIDQTEEAINELLKKYKVPRNYGLCLRHELKQEYQAREEAACKDTLAKMNPEHIAKLKAIMQNDENRDLQKMHIEEVLDTSVPFYRYGTWLDVMRSELQLEQESH